MVSAFTAYVTAVPSFYFFRVFPPTFSCWHVLRLTGTYSRVQTDWHVFQLFLAGTYSDWLAPSRIQTDWHAFQLFLAGTYSDWLARNSTFSCWHVLRLTGTYSRIQTDWHVIQLLLAGTYSDWLAPKVVFRLTGTYSNSFLLARTQTDWHLKSYSDWLARIPTLSCWHVLRLTGT